MLLAGTAAQFRTYMDIALHQTDEKIGLFVVGEPGDDSARCVGCRFLFIAGSGGGGHQIAIDAEKRHRRFERAGERVDARQRLRRVVR